MSKRTLTLKQRLLITGLALAVTPLLALGIVCWRQFDIISVTALQGSEKLAASDLAQAGETAYNAASAAQDDVMQSLRVAHAALSGYGGMQFARHRHTTWAAINQETHDEKKIALPAVLIGPKPDRHSRSATRKALVDEVMDITGASCTIFQRMNADGDMLRIATTVVNAQGKRAVGTYIPSRSADGRANPVLAAVLTGKPYRGKANVVGKPYITAYEPITAPDGSVIGMLYAGLPESVEAARLKDRLSSMRATGRGEVFALATAGPQSGEYLFSASRGLPTVPTGVSRQRLVEAALAHSDQPTVERYRSAQGVAMIAQLRYIESWKWLLGVAIPEADFLESAHRINDIAEHSHKWLAAVFLCSIVASLLIWTRYAGVLSASLTAFARSTHKDGIRILEWSRRLASASKEQGAGIVDQLAAVERSSSRIQRAAQDNEKRTDEALLNSAASGQQVHETKQHLTGMQASMQQLNSVNAKISGLMKSVDEIAFQSRILALNARIEAARAGEAGVSFAVVAEQFGALAERCAGAARSTTEFLTESSLSTREGMEKLHSLTLAVEQMEGAAAQMRSTVNQVHDAAGEQVRASAEIVGSLSMIKQVINRNEQMAQHSAHAGKELQNLAGELHQHTQGLSDMVDGGKSRPAAGLRLVSGEPKKAAKPQRVQRSVGAKAPANNRSARRAC